MVLAASVGKGSLGVMGMGVGSACQTVTVINIYFNTSYILSLSLALRRSIPHPVCSMRGGEDRTLRASAVHVTGSYVRTV